MNLKQAKAALALGLKVSLKLWRDQGSQAHIYMSNGETLMYVNPLMTHEPVDMNAGLLQDNEFEVFNELQSSEDHATDNG